MQKNIKLTTKQNELIEYIVNKTLTLIPNRKFPDKAIDVLDCSCVLARKKEVIWND